MQIAGNGKNSQRTTTRTKNGRPTTRTFYGVIFEGLCFIDVKASCTSVILSSGDNGSEPKPLGRDAAWYTAPITLNDYSNISSADVIKIDKTDSNVNTPHTITSAGLSLDTMRQVLTRFSSCTDSFASGYNAYAQIYYDFVVPTDKVNLNGNVNRET